MVIRLVLVLMLVLVLTSCVKKTEDQMYGESGSPEQNVQVTTEQITNQIPAVKDTEAVQGEESQLTESEGVDSASADFQKPSIKDIQQALKNAGLYDGEIDGVSGPKTKKAIETFQSQNDLTADGKVGPKTWEKLIQHLTKPE